MPTKISRITTESKGRPPLFYPTDKGGFLFGGAPARKHPPAPRGRSSAMGKRAGSGCPLLWPLLHPVEYKLRYSTG